MLPFYIIGGGFGGKALDTVEASGVAAVAAWKYVYNIIVPYNTELIHTLWASCSSCTINTKSFGFRE